MPTRWHFFSNFIRSYRNMLIVNKQMESYFLFIIKLIVCGKVILFGNRAIRIFILYHTNANIKSINLIKVCFFISLVNFHNPLVISKQSGLFHSSLILFSSYRIRFFFSPFSHFWKCSLLLSSLYNSGNYCSYFK